MPHINWNSQQKNTPNNHLRYIISRELPFTHIVSNCICTPFHAQKKGHHLSCLRIILYIHSRKSYPSSFWFIYCELRRVLFPPALSSSPKSPISPALINEFSMMICCTSLNTLLTLPWSVAHVKCANMFLSSD